MSCNDNKFRIEANNTKYCFNKQIIKHNLQDYVKVYDYLQGDNDIINNDTIYCNELDDYNHTYEKTIRCFEIIHKNNVEYDYIFRTNSSTFINIKLLYEFCKHISKYSFFDNKLFTSCLTSINYAFAPRQYDLVAQGKGLLFNKQLMNTLLANKWIHKRNDHLTNYIFCGTVFYNDIKNNTLEYKINKTDDVQISTIFNLLNLEQNKNIEDFYYTYCHHVCYENIKAFNRNVFDYIKYFITITVKAAPNRTVDVNKDMQELTNIVINNDYKDDNDIHNVILENLKFNEMTPVFRGFNEKPMYKYIKRNIDYEL